MIPSSRRRRDQRRRLARELHDEPPQLFLHLARRLAALEATTGAPDLGEARAQALAAAVRLRSVARDLHPPALDHRDQLGLLAGLSSFLAEVDDQTGLQHRHGGDRSTGASLPRRRARRLPDRPRSGAQHHPPRRRSPSARRCPVRARRPGARRHRRGRGFAPDNADEVASGHLGLLGMAKRASLLGGHPEVRSAPGKRGARPRDPPARPPRTRPAVPPRG